MAHAIGFPAIHFSQRRMSAAALSAAVDSAKLIEATSNSQAEPTKQNHTSPTPAALRERGVWGERRFSQRSGLSPQRSLPVFSSGSAREGTFLQKSPLPRNPSQIHSRVDFPDVAAFDGAELPARLHQGRNENNAFENAADTLAGVAAGHIVWIGRDDD